MMLLSFFTGCSTKNEIPDVVKNMKGGEKWETKIDYANTDNWLAINDTGKDVDVIYFYPTTFTKASDDAPNVADIDDAGMRADAQRVLTLQASVFEEDCNIYAPYYRQVSAPYALSLSDEDSEALLSYSASQDPTAALDYYFKHYNNGKPFILAGHSQGSQVVITLLAGYMEEHPEYYKNMIATYAIGYSVTEEYLLANPHLKFAEGAVDTGIIVSYSTTQRDRAIRISATVLSRKVRFQSIQSTGSGMKHMQASRKTRVRLCWAMLLKVWRTQR